MFLLANPDQRADQSDSTLQHGQFQQNLHEVCVTLNAKCHAATRKLVNENLVTRHSRPVEGDMLNNTTFIIEDTK